MRPIVLVVLAALASSTATPAFAAACTCESLKSLQNELKIALLLRDKHASKAKELREKYGDEPKGADIHAARENYLAFEAPPAPGQPPAAGSARDGLPNATPGAPAEIAYVPRGSKLREDGAMGRAGGVDPAIAFTPIGDKIPDLDKRRAIEKSFRDKKQDLCAPQDEAAMTKAAQLGSVCDAIAKALVAHEATHRKTCERMGFYAFYDRHAVQLADNEVDAYKEQIRVLADEIRRILKQKKTKATSGTPGADPESLLAIEARCALAFTVVGQVDDLKFSDKVCDSAEAFTVKTSPNANFRFTPSGEKAGTYAYRGQIAGATFYGNGGYSLELSDGKGSVVLDGAGRWNVKHPLGVSSKGGPETLRATELPEGCS